MKCIPHANEQVKRNKLTYAIVHSEMRKEKQNALKVIQESFGCKGCGKDCCVNLEDVYDTLVKEMVAMRIWHLIRSHSSLNGTMITHLISTKMCPVLKQRPLE